MSEECETLKVKLVKYDKMYADIIDEISIEFKDIKVRTQNKQS